MKTTFLESNIKNIKNLQNSLQEVTSTVRQLLDNTNESDLAFQNIQAVCGIQDCRFNTLLVLSEINSTNDFLKSVALKAPDGLVVLARSQTAGRGRRSRRWIMRADGSLIMSCLLKNVDRFTLNWINSAAATAVCVTLNEIFTSEFKIKWPNDVIYCDQVKFDQKHISENVQMKRESFNGYKKICGILSESEINANGVVDYVVIGMGLNILKFESDTYTTDELSNDPNSEILLNPISLEEVVINYTDDGVISNEPNIYNIDSDVVDIPLLALRILNKIDFYLKTIENGGIEDFLKVYKSSCATLNTSVRVYLDNDKIIEGVASGLGPMGELEVVTDSGRVLVNVGDVVHLR